MRKLILAATDLVLGLPWPLAARAGTLSRLHRPHTTRHWAAGSQPIPPAIADWLEKWVRVRTEHPDPAPPEDWHQRSAVA